MAAEEIHALDQGTQIRLTVYDGADLVDLSGSSSKVIKFEKPDGTDVEKTASFLTDGTDGIIYYTTESGFLDAEGVWKMQAILGFSTSQFRSDVKKFRVYSNI